MLCIASSHNGHHCVTIDEYFEGQREDMEQLILNAEESVTMLQYRMNSVALERTIADVNMVSLRTEINNYMNKVRQVFTSLRY